MVGPDGAPNRGRPENATFGVNASRVLLPLTIHNVENLSIFILFSKKKAKRNTFLQKKKQEKRKKETKKKKTNRKKRIKTGAVFPDFLNFLNLFNFF